jgi:hypothetical protein
MRTGVVGIIGLAALVILADGREGQAVQEPHWLGISGEEWRRWSPEARQAYLAGFLAGGALGETLDAGAADSGSLARGLDSLRRKGFRFPYAPQVYEARVQDYFWWEDHRPAPVWYALWEVNNDLKRMTRQDGQ